jgi:hypothetical protein
MWFIRFSWTIAHWFISVIIVNIFFVARVSFRHLSNFDCWLWYPAIRSHYLVENFFSIFNLISLVRWRLLSTPQITKGPCIRGLIQFGKHQVLLLNFGNSILIVLQTANNRILTCFTTVVKCFIDKFKIFGAPRCCLFSFNRITDS